MLNKLGSAILNESQYTTVCLFLGKRTYERETKVRREFIAEHPKLLAINLQKNN